MLWPPASSTISPKLAGPKVRQHTIVAGNSGRAFDEDLRTYQVACLGKPVRHQRNLGAAIVDEFLRFRRVCSEDAAEQFDAFFTVLLRIYPEIEIDDRDTGSRRLLLDAGFLSGLLRLQD